MTKALSAHDAGVLLGAEDVTPRLRISTPLSPYWFELN